MPRIIDADPCLKKARDDEPVFIILGRDPVATATVHAWADAREQCIADGVLDDNEHERAHIAEARTIADEMGRYVRNLRATEQT